MAREQVDEDVRDTIRLLASEDKRRVLELAGDENLSGIEDRLEDRGYTFVRQSFLDLEELGLVDREEEGDYDTAYRTSQGDHVLEKREEFDCWYREAVERFFRHEHSVEDVKLVHDIVDFGEQGMGIKVPGIPEEFLRMQDMFDLFHGLEPDQRMNDLSEEFDITEPSVRKRLQSLERYGMVNERKPNSHEKQYFYGPFAFPMLKLASEIEDVYSPGVDWEWILEEEDEETEPEFIEYSNRREREENPDWSAARGYQGENLRENTVEERDPVDGTSEVFVSYNGLPEEYALEKLEAVESLEEFDELLGEDERGAHEVAAVNNDNVVLKGGYIWKDYADQRIEEGDLLMVEYSDGSAVGFDEVAALGKIGSEAGILRE